MWIAASRIMGNPRKKQPAHDPQIVNAQERTGVQQQELTRREPTPEDKYFFEQEREKSSEEQREKQEKEDRTRLKSAGAPANEKVTDGIFGRLYRAFIRQFDTRWRP
jgi:hypothetical protein